MRLKPGADTAVMDSTGHVRDHFRRVPDPGRYLSTRPKPAQERLLRSYCGAARFAALAARRQNHQPRTRPGVGRERSGSHLTVEVRRVHPFRRLGAGVSFWTHPCHLAAEPSGRSGRRRWSGRVAARGAGRPPCRGGTLPVGVLAHERAVHLHQLVDHGVVDVAATAESSAVASSTT